MLKWLRKNSRLGFFINDLHRHFLAWSSIKLLTGIFSKSHMVQYDAPLSVKRGFRKAEWRALLDEAGIDDASIAWKWAFRHLVVGLTPAPVRPGHPGGLSKGEGEKSLSPTLSKGEGENTG
jgi:hypothetical protein